jgi:hypothetical protein
MCCLRPLEDANVLPHELHACPRDSDSLPLELALVTLCVYDGFFI